MHIGRPIGRKAVCAQKAAHPAARPFTKMAAAILQKKSPPFFWRASDQ